MVSDMKDEGESTRRAVVVISEAPLTVEALINRVNKETPWKASPSQNLFALVIEQGDKRIEFKKLGDHTFKSVNVFPQDLEHRHVSFEEDALNELAPVLESLNMTIAWVLADDDEIKTTK